jgi:flagellar motor component MotA
VLTVLGLGTMGLGVVAGVVGLVEGLQFIDLQGQNAKDHTNTSYQGVKDFCKDPPWDDVPSLVATLSELAQRLRSGGWLVLEHARRTPAPEIQGVHLLETRVWGDTAVSFFEL